MIKHAPEQAVTVQVLNRMPVRKDLQNRLVHLLGRQVLEHVHNCLPELVGRNLMQTMS